MTLEDELPALRRDYPDWTFTLADLNGTPFIAATHPQEPFGESIINDIDLRSFRTLRDAAARAAAPDARAAVARYAQGWATGISPEMQSLIDAIPQDLPPGLPTVDFVLLLAVPAMASGADFFRVIYRRFSGVVVLFPVGDQGAEQGLSRGLGWELHATGIFSVGTLRHLDMSSEVLVATVDLALHTAMDTFKRAVDKLWVNLTPVEQQELVAWEQEMRAGAVRRAEGTA